MLSGFKKANGELLSKEELLKTIENFIKEDRNFEYKVMVGTDSEMFERKVEFISVIAVHRLGRGGRFFWKKTLFNKPLALYDRLWQEAIISLNISEALIKELNKKNLTFSFELHLDLGTNGKSHSTIREIISLVKSYGFEVKTKPFSYAASKVADKLL
ncbi:MAG: ribonuclease H-like YkuK family protein [Candidatus Pacebacteria bacterium]|jgi:predicted RNase H-related nuclease YkuK (DUF458 family)|nr:ribonuclease H-like YkuK family protein [Candidatus Paceibacterota bacterium]